MSHTEPLSTVLDKIVRKFVDMCGKAVQDVVIARSDGLVVYSYSTSLNPTQRRSIAALISLLMGSSKKIYSQLRDDELVSIIMEGRRSKIILKSITLPSGRDVYVSVLVSSVDEGEPNIGLILLMLDNLVEKLREVFR